MLDPRKTPLGSEDLLSQGKQEADWSVVGTDPESRWTMTQQILLLPSTPGPPVTPRAGSSGNGGKEGAGLDSLG